MQKILLITGWGVGTQPLEALKNALVTHGFHVDLINIFDGFNRDILDQHAQMAHKSDVIMGWSLGGQLAALLTQHVYEKFGDVKTLITLASNPCFVEQEGWDVGMPFSTFLNFQQSFEKEPLMTIKRFCYLVTQGGINAKQDWQWLQNLIQADDKKLKSQGLELLYRLNTVDILKNFNGKQLHIFAEDDGLVSHKIIENLRKLDAKYLKVESVSGSHGFPIFQIEWLSDKIVQYLKRNEKT